MATKLDCGCSSSKDYSDDYDAYFCASCNVWLESGCKDPDCIFCKDRPNTPFPTLDKIDDIQNFLNTLED